MLYRLFAVIALAAILPAAPLRAEDKIDCATASSTADLNACADEEYSRADAALNEAYKKALAAIPGLAFEKPYDAVSWEEALRASQRAWVAYRDAECKGHVPMFWTGGSATSGEVLGCMTELTRARTIELNSHYDAQ